MKLRLIGKKSTVDNRTWEDWFDAANRFEDILAFDKAEDAYRKSLAMKPTFEAWFNLGNVLDKQNRPHDAITCYERAIEFADSEAAVECAWNNMGVLLQDFGRNEEAARAYRQAIRINQCYLDARINFMWLAESGKLHVRLHKGA